MHPSQRPAGPGEVLMSLWRHRALVWQMTRRDVVGRYRGSLLGLLWSLLNPIFMLAVYTFVFSVVFEARWGTASESKTEFAQVLFAGMIIHSLFAECLNRAPGLILSNANYVKKVVFPLEILPWVAMGSTLFHAAISVLVLLIFFLGIEHYLHWTVLLLPVLLFPFVLLTMGFCWFLAATGVFLRDVGQTTGIVTTALLFLSPVFYPVSALPEAYRPFIYLSPLTFMIEQARGALLWGTTPDWTGLGIYLVFGVLAAWAGFVWFQKTRKGFADVL